MSRDDLDRALAVLGPLEGRIMRAVWTGAVAEPFVVRDVLALMPELAYTTIMTTLRRLADKGLLTATADTGMRAHEYRRAGSPADFLAAASAQEAARFVDAYGDAALAAFAARLADLTPEQRRRLEDLRK
ncbi:BlaI/MecI/CopY family transcriptional regulator [Nonomuraea basaltis]|uniref:BlaI/MecI/CopY family transcriptional regulator n=1 Tax=Nonomuraea basaltis TaxID=2495887 RepID=UPI00110C6C8A|nr:BlaI/MecI/CopY family transcriptional regulator [Nonomuraea basaltis]TMR95780.1 BlaI/MecI/CopY family transcriptional regulator [Nonomuraea basaltis]